MIEKLLDPLKFMLDLLKEGKEKSDVVNLVEQKVLLPEIKENFINLLRMRSNIPYTDLTISFIEALEFFDEKKFEEGPMDWPLITLLSTESFDKVKIELIKYPSSLTKDLFDLYNAFEVYKSKGNTLYFSNEEYKQFRKVILNQYQKYML